MSEQQPSAVDIEQLQVNLKNNIKGLLDSHYIESVDFGDEFDNDGKEPLMMTIKLFPRGTTVLA